MELILYSWDSTGLSLFLSEAAIEEDGPPAS